MSIFLYMLPNALTNVYMLNFLVRFCKKYFIMISIFVFIFWPFIVNQSQTLSVSGVISVWSALCVTFYGVELASSSLHKPLSHKTRITQPTVSCWVAKVCLCSVRWHFEVINSVYTVLYNMHFHLNKPLLPVWILGSWSKHKLFTDVPLSACHTSDTFLLMIDWMSFEFYRQTWVNL